MALFYVVVLLIRCYVGRTQYRQGAKVAQGKWRGFGGRERNLGGEPLRTMAQASGRGESASHLRTILLKVISLAYQTKMFVSWCAGFIDFENKTSLKTGFSCVKWFQKKPYLITKFDKSLRPTMKHLFLFVCKVNSRS